MQMSIEMDDSVLQPLIKQFRRSRLIIENEQAAVTEATTLLAPERAPQTRAELLRLFENSTLVRGTPFSRKIRARWNEWEKLSEQDLKARLENQKKELNQLLDRQADLHRESKALSDAEQARLRVLYLQTDLGNFESALRGYEAAYMEGGRTKMPTTPAGQRRRLTDFQTSLIPGKKVLVVTRDGLSTSAERQRQSAHLEYRFAHLTRIPRAQQLPCVADLPTNASGAPCKKPRT